MIVGVFGKLGDGMNVSGSLNPFLDDFGSVPLSLNDDFNINKVKRLNDDFNINKVKSFSDGKNPFRPESLFVTRCFVEGNFCSIGVKRRFGLCLKCSMRFQTRIAEFLK